MTAALVATIDAAPVMDAFEGGVTFGLTLFFIIFAAVVGGLAFRRILGV